MPEENEYRLNIELYRVSENSDYCRKKLKDAIDAQGPMRKDYRLLIQSELKQKPDNGIPGYVSEILKSGCEGREPQQSDVLVIHSPATGTNAYYLSEGRWERVLFL